MFFGNDNKRLQNCHNAEDHNPHSTAVKISLHLHLYCKCRVPDTRGPTEVLLTRNNESHSQRAARDVTVLTVHYETLRHSVSEETGGLPQHNSHDCGH